MKGLVGRSLRKAKRMRGVLERVTSRVVAANSRCSFVRLRVGPMVVTKGIRA